MAGRFEWEPDSYPALMREEIPGYDLLQEALVAATRGRDVDSILELGTGMGQTARRLLAAHPGAHLHGVDASTAMLAAARRTLAGADVVLELGRIEDPLPAGPFALLASALAVHHLDAAGKRSLFAAIATRLGPGGRFVLGDLVVPEDPGDVVTAIDGIYDTPSSVAEQLRWLDAAGLRARVQWQRRDLAVIVAERA
jgi:tRNA (cmo5U34)-methyltransferase